MNRLRQLVAELSAAVGRLSPRERGLVALTGTVLVLFIVLVSSLTISSSIKRREGRIRTKTQQLEEIAKLTGSFRQVEMKRTELEAKLRASKSVRLFSFVEDLAKRHGIDIGGMNDKGSQPLGDSKITEASVEVPLTRISLEKLSRFLADLEADTSKLVKVTRLQVRPRSDEPVIDAWMVVSTYQLSDS